MHATSARARAREAGPAFSKNNAQPARGRGGGLPVVRVPGIWYSSEYRIPYLKRFFDIKWLRFFPGIGPNNWWLANGWVETGPVRPPAGCKGS